VEKAVEIIRIGAKMKGLELYYYCNDNLPAEVITDA
jgi:hypothetical protein